MTKLLTERELKTKLMNFLVRYGLSVIERNALTPMREEIDAAYSELQNIVNEQKQAHADMVIGEDEAFLKEPTPAFEGAYTIANERIEAKNHLRAEQRERNTL